jgi:hypothetical protein
VQNHVFLVRQILLAISLKVSIWKVNGWLVLRVQAASFRTQVLSENSSEDKSDHGGEDDQGGDKSKRGALQEQDSSDEEQFDYSACYESTGERRGNPKYPDLKVRESKIMRTRGDAGAIGAIRQNLESNKRITELEETKKARYNKYEIIYYYDPKSTPPRYWAGEIKNIYLPGEFPNPADSPDIRYLICPGSDHGMHQTPQHCCNRKEPKTFVVGGETKSHAND